MAGRGRGSGGTRRSGGRNADPKVTAARMLRKQIDRAEAGAAKLEAQAKTKREAVEPLKASLDALGDVGE